jgi:hypothetical protein
MRFSAIAGGVVCSFFKVGRGGKYELIIHTWGAYATYSTLRRAHIHIFQTCGGAYAWSCGRASAECLIKRRARMLSKLDSRVRMSRGPCDGPEA